MNNNNTRRNILKARKALTSVNQVSTTTEQHSLVCSIGDALDHFMDIYEIESNISRNGRYVAPLRRGGSYR